jgi:hypothetical protein
MHEEFLSEKLKGRDHRKDLGVNGGVILKWIIKRIGEYGLDLSGSVTSSRLL